MNETGSSRPSPNNSPVNWPESKIIRLLSAVLPEQGVPGRLILDPTQIGYQKNGFPYFGSTLYFDPFLYTNW